MSRLSSLLTTGNVLFVYLLHLTRLLAALDLDGVDLIKQIHFAGYDIQVHLVTTEDGYILTMHRIVQKTVSRTSIEEMIYQPTVLLMHGMMKTSASFINEGPYKNFAYDLVNAGYDVWVGNARGSPYSRRHTSLDPDDDKDKFDYFKFGWEEIGTIDIAAMVKHILASTAADLVTFVGDAEGATAFLILNSLKPEYNSKFELAVLLNPVGYTHHFPSAELQTAASMIDDLYKMGLNLGLVEISSLDLHSNSRADAEISLHFIIQSVVSFVASVGRFTPVGTSLKHIVHYGQNIRDETFRRWNYGRDTNQEIYGTFNPPKYNLTAVNVELVMYYRQGDNLVDERDVEALANDIPEAAAVMFKDPKEIILFLSSRIGTDD